MAPEQLISAIRAALDDTERIAREATSGPWTADTPMATDGVRSAIASIGEFQVWVADCRYEHMGPLAITNARHIAHNDPAAVLRRVAAFREIVDAYEQAINDNRYGIAEVCDEYRYAILPALARGLGINPETETR